MKKILLLILLIPCLAFAKYASTISPITPAIKKRMIQGNSWRKGCPVGLNDLRYITLTHIGFDGKEKKGELIMHRSVAKEITQIFGELYRHRYPIRKMRLVSDYKGSDWQSIEGDNTSAFNCRKATGSSKYSRHALGMAIDINPIENPYVSRRGTTSHKMSRKYLKRKRTGKSAAQRAIMLPGDPIVKAFKKRGWRWGGDFRGVKDYQHFDKR